MYIEVQECQKRCIGQKRQHNILWSKWNFHVDTDNMDKMKASRYVIEQNKYMHLCVRT
jgi:hypothetical protein